MLKSDDICKKILVSEEEIDKICRRLGEEITNDYKGKDILLIGLLNGCNPFLSDLAKRIDLRVEIEYMEATSYEGTNKVAGSVTILKNIGTSIKGKDIIIVDDIIDTGETLKSITSILESKGASSIESCVLLDKLKERSVNYSPKYVGTTVPNEFVVGYGLDYNEYYRNLPYVGVVKDEIANK